MAEWFGRASDFNPNALCIRGSNPLPGVTFLRFSFSFKKQINAKVLKISLFKFFKADFRREAIK